MTTCPICLGLETKQNYRDGTWREYCGIINDKYVENVTLCLRHSEELLNE